MFVSSYESKEWKYIPNSQLLKIGSERIKLRLHVAQLLEILCENSNNTVSHELLIDEIWGRNYFGDLNCLRTAIWELRQHINEVKTIPRKGYTLNTTIIKTGAREYFKSLNKIKFTSLVIFVIVLTVSSILLLIQSKNNKLTLDKATLLTSDIGIEESPAISPDNKYLAYAKHSQNGSYGIYIKSLIDPQINDVLISDPNRISGSPTWNNDQTKLAYLQKTSVGIQCKVIIYDLINKSSQIVAESSNVPLIETPIGLDWSPDGKYLVFPLKLENEWRTAITLFNVSNGEQTQLTQPTFIDVNPKWNKKGNQILFSRFESPDEAHVYSVDLKGNTNLLVEIGSFLMGYDTLNENNLIISTYKNGVWGGYIYNLQNKQLTHYPFGDGFQMPDVINNEIYYIKSSMNMSIYSSDLIRQNNKFKFSEINLPYLKHFDPQFNQFKNTFTYISSQSGHQELWEYDINKKNTIQLTHLQSRVSFHASSPSGNLIAFTHKNFNKDNNTQISILNKSNNELIPMTNIDGNFTYAAWLNEDQIAAIRINGENRELWLHDISDPNSGRLLIESDVENVKGVTSLNSLLVKQKSKYFLMEPNNLNKKQALDFLENGLYLATKKGIYGFDEDHYFTFRAYDNLSQNILLQVEKIDMSIQGFAIDETNNKIYWLIDNGAEKGVYKRVINGL